MAVVRSIFAGKEQAFSRDWVACADLRNGMLGGTAMGSQSLDCPELGALNGVGVRLEARGRKLAEHCCRSILETLDASKVRAAFLAKAEPHRERYRQLMKELTGRKCGRPPHKLGLRTPHPGPAATLAVRAYLFAKGLLG